MTDEKNGTPPANGDEGATYKGITKATKAMDLWLDPKKLLNMCFPQLKKGNSPAQLQQAKEDVFYLMAYGLEIGANPMTKDIYVYRTNKTDKSESELVIIHSINFMLERAQLQTGYLSHFMQAIYRNDKFKKIVTLEGVKIEHEPDVLKGFDERGQIVGAYAVGRKIVGSKIETFYQEVNWGAYDTGKKFWNKDPEGQITKCALAKLLRHMFPGALKRAYIEAEMSPIIDVEAITAPAQPPTLDSQKIDIDEMRRRVDEALMNAYDNADSIEEVILNLTKTDKFPGYTSLKEIADTVTLQVIQAEAERELKQNAIN